MGRKLRNFLKFCILIFPFVAYLVHFGCKGELSFVSFLGEYFGLFNPFFEPIIESFIGETGLLYLVNGAAVSLIANLLGYFIVYSIVLLVYELFAFIPSVMAHWLEKMKKGE